MKRSIVAALAVLVLLGRPGEAQETDHEASFNEAYLLEVVEGRVAEAAREYVRIMDAEDAGAALRGEARFRFAVCCVLLGRADEARSQLDRILADEAQPDVLRNRAKEYRASLDGVGIGSELDKRLSEVAFEMGREPVSAPSAGPAAYREFQVIGKPAVPFLLELLAHPDADLRQHAFRVLCRMDEPGMVARWDQWRFPSRGLQIDLSDYAFRHEAERAAAERMILDAPKKDRGDLLNAFSRTTNFSVALPRGIAAAEGEEENALAAALKTVPAEATLALRLEWLMGDNAALSTGAAQQLCSTAAVHGIPDELGRLEVFVRILDRLVGRQLGWPRPGASQSMLVPIAGVRALADSMPSGVVLSEIRGILDAGAAWDDPSDIHPLSTGLPHPLAESLDARDLSAAELVEYEGLLRNWQSIATSAFGEPDPWFATHMVALLDRLPGERVGPFLAHIEEHRGSRPLHALLPRWFVRAAKEVPVLIAVLRASPEQFHRDLLIKIRIEVRGSVSNDIELATAIAARAEELADAVGDSALLTLADYVRAVAMALPEDEAADFLASVAPRFLRDSSPNLGSIIKRLIYFVPDQTAAFRGAVLKAIPRMAELGGKRALGLLMQESMNMLQAHDQGQIPLGESLPALAAFILDHLPDLDRGYFSYLIPHPDLFPLEAWAPYARPELWGDTRARMPQESLTPEVVDPVARVLTAVPAEVNESVLALVVKRASEEAKREILERMVLAGGGLPAFVLAGPQGTTYLPATGAPVRPEVLEDALAKCLAEEHPDLRSIAALANALAATRPSEKIVPAVRALLTSGDRTMILTACGLASGLGREDLLPDLVELLDSMDVGIRGAAQSAMNEILELRKLKEDARSRIATSGD